MVGFVCSFPTQENCEDSTPEPRDLDRDAISPGETQYMQTADVDNTTGRSGNDDLASARDQARDTLEHGDVVDSLASTPSLQPN